jgi:hypothetical protein
VKEREREREDKEYTVGVDMRRYEGQWKGAVRVELDVGGEV